MMKFYRYRRPITKFYVIGVDLAARCFIDADGLGKLGNRTDNINQVIDEENYDQIELEDMTAEEMLTRTDEFWRAVMEYPR